MKAYHVFCVCKEDGIGSWEYIEARSPLEAEHEVLSRYERETQEERYEVAFVQEVPIGEDAPIGFAHIDDFFSQD